MSIRKVKVSLVTLTPELLTEFRQAVPLPGERAVKAARVKQLTELIEGGQFVGVDWHRGRCVANDQLYRLDGQHTTALLQDLVDHPRAERPFPADLPATITDWEFGSIEEAAQIFDIFNNPMSARGNKDKMQIYQAAFPDLAGIDPLLLMRALNGISFFEKLQRQGKKKKSTDDGSEQLSLGLDARNAGIRLHEDQVRAFVHWLQPFAELRLFGKVITRQGVVAQLYADWLENATTASTFWTLVLSEAATDPDDETRVFAEELKRMNRAAKRVKQDAYFKAAAQAWKRYKGTLTKAA